MVFVHFPRKKLCVVAVGMSKISLKIARRRWRIIWFREKKNKNYSHGHETHYCTLASWPNCFNSMFFSRVISSINRNYDITLKLSVLALANCFLPPNHTT